MPRSLIRSDNKRWSTCGIYAGGETSERGVLYWAIRMHNLAGKTINTVQLIEKVRIQSGEEVAKRVPSRLIELERDGFIKSEFDADLFS